MARRVKDFIEISEFTSLEDLIKFLKLVRETSPRTAKPSSGSAATNYSATG